MSYTLTRETLNALPSRIIRPDYNFQDLLPGIVHIGTGNFHRAHQVLYLDDLFNLGLDQDWAIVGSGVRPHDAEMREALLNQDFLSTVVELEPGANKARISGPMLNILPVEAGNHSLVRALSAPWARIVSMTITEGGYFINPATGKFNPEHPEMIADARNPRKSKQ